MEKQKSDLPKRLLWIFGTALWISLALVAQGAAEEKKEITSPGEAIGEAARRVTEESKAAYHETQEGVVKTSREVVEGAKKAFQEAKGAGTTVVKDVKAGFTKGPSAPAGASTGAKDGPSAKSKPDE
jgi:hypothetical protein